ncbi:hypothetical protein Desor_1438 [Desulfosporosinus orientis DSM 765]|uniref:Uncharacterized protein n=1 Tax=Desulfosporosinus orientis (strain ATCC 19365 / DSM 765 / NCIMB 8382 / VKM B-1628 / Singapore I) TaxID=768706 RepID=G7W8F5_DESOD|nr:hypothetical protein Desor_1438 [Desulfosporosinus orientis DSM 765]
MVILLIFLFSIIILIEVPGLIQQKYWRELVVFSLLLSFGFLFSLLHTIGVPLPSTAKIIAYLVRDVLHLNYQ